MEESRNALEAEIEEVVQIGEELRELPLGVAPVKADELQAQEGADRKPDERPGRPPPR